MAIKLDESTAYLANKTSKKLADEMSLRLSHAGMTRNQWLAMHYIFNDHGLNQKELAKKLGVKESSCTVLVEGLEKQSFISREIHEGDKRQRVLVLTEVGLHKLNELNTIAEGFERDVSKHLSEEERRVFFHVLEKMQQGVN